MNVSQDNTKIEQLIRVCNYTLAIKVVPIEILTIRRCDDGDEDDDDEKLNQARL